MYSRYYYIRIAAHCGKYLQSIAEKIDGNRGGERMEPYLIGIAGGTGSGKSTVTEKLRAYFGSDISVISYDDYYKRQDDLSLEEREKTNYDHPDSLETELLLSHLCELKAGRAIECPVYDFSVHNRSNETKTIEPASVIIVEGILLFCSKELRDMLDLKVFVDSDADERILRRIYRDMEKRGRDFGSIMKQYLTTVKPMHLLFVEPTKSMADLVLNGGCNPRAANVLIQYIRSILNPEAADEAPGNQREE